MKNETETEKEYAYAFTYDNKPKGIISTLFYSKEEALKNKSLYKKKGWVCKLIKVEKPKPLTEEEHKNLNELSEFINQITGQRGNT